HSGVHWGAVIYDVKVRRLEIDDAPTTRVLDICVTDIPLFRNRPDEHLGAGWDFRNSQRNSFVDLRQGFPDTVARNTATNRIQVGCKTMQIVTDFRSIAAVKFFQQAHVFSKTLIPTISLEIGVGSVAIRHHYRPCRPIDLEGGIIPSHSTG